MQGNLTWIEPIFDRTQKDVDDAARIIQTRYEELIDDEKKQYINGLKGCLNKSDIERVLNNINYINDFIDVDLMENTVPTNIYTAFTQGIVDNVKRIKEKFAISIDVPEVPLNHWKKWNAIEEILYKAYQIIGRNDYTYVGEKILGDNTDII